MQCDRSFLDLAKCREDLEKVLIIYIPGQVADLKSGGLYLFYLETYANLSQAKSYAVKNA